MNIASQLRHLLTFLAGLGGLFLSWHLIAPDQAAAVDKAGADLIEPLVIIFGAVAAGVARLAIGWGSKFFSRAAGNVRTRMNGLTLWLGLISTAVVLGGLPSCAFLEDMPLSVGVTTDDATAHYSSKGGLVVSAKVRSKINRHSAK